VGLGDVFLAAARMLSVSALARSQSSRCFSTSAVAAASLAFHLGQARVAGPVRGGRRGLAERRSGRR
jgi:hypothetical protein